MAHCSIPVATMMVAGAVVMAGMLGWRRHMFCHHAHCHAYCGCGPHEAHGESCTCKEHGGSGPCGCHTHHAGGGRAWGNRFARRFWLRALLFKIHATPAQEKDLEVAFDEFDKHASEAKALVESSRQAAARAMEGDAFDDGAMGEAQAKAAEASQQIKNAFEVALRRVHSVLDKDQRKQLARLLALGSHGWWHNHHGCSHHEC